MGGFRRPALQPANHSVGWRFTKPHAPRPSPSGSGPSHLPIRIVDGAPALCMKCHKKYIVVILHSANLEFPSNHTTLYIGLRSAPVFYFSSSYFSCRPYLSSPVSDHSAIRKGIHTYHRVPYPCIHHHHHGLQLHPPTAHNTGRPRPGRAHPRRCLCVGRQEWLRRGRVYGLQRTVHPTLLYPAQSPSIITSRKKKNSLASPSWPWATSSPRRSGCRAFTTSGPCSASRR